ncbi:unnamed protein product, partial [Meganyctiphanes norvegica]
MLTIYKMLVISITSTNTLYGIVTVRMFFYLSPKKVYELLFCNLHDTTVCQIQSNGGSFFLYIQGVKVHNINTSKQIWSSSLRLILYENQGIMPTLWVRSMFFLNTAAQVLEKCTMLIVLENPDREIKVKSVKGNEFWRVLLSMHASCNEVLDLVSYLRPRKVYPNVIPARSSKEEVLRLLHEALNRSGDHYSIEYGGSGSSNQRKPLGSFKRQLQSNESNSSIATLESSMYDGSSLSSLHKRRRHSDSNMTLILPTPRGNMKGSLSLEGEAGRSEQGHQMESEMEDIKYDSAYQSHEKEEKSFNDIMSKMLPIATSSGVGSLESSCAAVEATSLSPPPPSTPPPPSGPLIWIDPYTPSPNKSGSECRPKLTNTSHNEHQLSGIKTLNTNTAKTDLTCKLETSSSEVPTSDNNCSETMLRNIIVKVTPAFTTYDACKSVSGIVAASKVVDVYNKGWQAMSVDNDDDNQSMASYIRTQGSQDSIDLASVFSEEPPDSPQDFRDGGEPRPCSSAGVAGERGVAVGGESAMKRCRKQWYKHKYFSTPVHEDGDKRRMVPLQAKPTIGPRSCSLPLPDPYHREEMVSPDICDVNSPNSSLPVITVSSPSDVSCTESQRSDDTNVTVVLGSGDPNDPCGDPTDFVDPMVVDDAEHSMYVDTSGAINTTSFVTVPPTTTVPTNFPSQLSAEATTITPQHLQRPSVICGPPVTPTTKGEPLGGFVSSHYHHRSSFSSLSPSDSSPSDSTSSGRKASLSSPHLVDLVSDSDCTPELEDLLALQGQVTQVTVGQVTQVTLGQVQEVTVNTQDCSSRTSCLKTTRRRDNEVEVSVFNHY